jgi:hypothetical protein
LQRVDWLQIGGLEQVDLASDVGHCDVGSGPVDGSKLQDLLLLCEVDFVFGQDLNFLFGVVESDEAIAALGFKNNFLRK